MAFLPSCFAHNTLLKFAQAAFQQNPPPSIVPTFVHNLPYYANVCSPVTYRRCLTLTIPPLPKRKHTARSVLQHRPLKHIWE